jgi:23S rRNA (uracil1939-C5)-methyltransferase
VLVHKALGLLEVQPQDRVADLFCGLGNFTLPLATQGREVVGIEGATSLTERALDNARANGLSDKTTFYTRNLFEVTAEHLIELGKFDRMLVDPPRDGAMALSDALVELSQTRADLLPKRIVDAGARRRHPGQRRLCAEQGRRGQHVPAHFARGIDGGI